MSEPVKIVLSHHWSDHRACCGTTRQPDCAEAEHRKPYEELDVAPELARALVEDAFVATYESEADALLAHGDRRNPRFIAPPKDQRKADAAGPTMDELVAQAEVAGVEVKSGMSRRQIAVAIIRAEHEAAKAAIKEAAASGQTAK